MMKTFFAVGLTTITVLLNDVQAMNEVGIRIIAPTNECSGKDHQVIQSILDYVFQKQQQLLRNLRSHQDLSNSILLSADCGERCFMDRVLRSRMYTPAGSRRAQQASPFDTNDINHVESVIVEDETTCEAKRLLVHDSLSRTDKLSESCKSVTEYIAIDCFALSFGTVSAV